MQATGNAVMTFAVNSEGRVVHISEVKNGGACQCTCPLCHSLLVAKNGGQERAHHFAHNNSTESFGCAETALHLAAKQIVAKHKTMTAPLRHPEQLSGEILMLEDIRLEHRLEIPTDQSWLVADCFGYTKGKPIVIEVAVNHKVDPTKSNKLELLNIQAIEIDLSDWRGQVWGWEELENAVLVDPQRRKWISHEVMVNLPSAPPEINKTTGQWLFSIGNRWIWINTLPSGDLRVFHKPDQKVRHIVEKICRGKGYWNGAPYFNWIVFKHFQGDLLSELRQFATELSVSLS
ncbi:hypothetical protein [Chitinibacter tainanensis]|uniref:DUF7828 domain-containing protein n=1 Tax=Chitinibacter tainanensis TaxID=230667 RepID=UPI0023555626|nr:hypothetical protein [Chitinibacter tainanensis]